MQACDPAGKDLTSSRTHLTFVQRLHNGFEETPPHTRRAPKCRKCPQAKYKGELLTGGITLPVYGWNSTSIFCRWLNAFSVSRILGESAVCPGVNHRGRRRDWGWRCNNSGVRRQALCLIYGFHADSQRPEHSGDTISECVGGMCTLCLSDWQALEISGVIKILDTSRS